MEPKLRPLRYPSSWGGSGPPQEKGVDVAIALAAVELTMSDACDVVVLFSNDTDLKPVIETVARLKDPSAIETASWSAPGFNQRLRGPGVFHHYVPRIQYGVVQDHVNYAHRGTR